MEQRDAAVFEAPSFASLWSAALPPGLSSRLCEYLRSRRWFRGKARSIRDLELLDQLPLRGAPRELSLLVLRVEYATGPSESYILPLACAPAADGGGLFELQLAGSVRRTVYDPSSEEELAQLLLELFVRDATQGETGCIEARPSRALRALLAPGQPRLPPHVLSGEQSNTCVFFGSELMLKLYRELSPGENPDVELGEFLWASGYRHVAEPLGSVRYARAGEVSTLGIVQRFVPNEGSAWEVTLATLRQSLELVRSADPAAARQGLPSHDLLESTRQTPSESVAGFLAAYAPLASLLGERTAQLHRALASNPELAAFRPEPITAEYQSGVVLATRERVMHGYGLLAEQLPSLPEGQRPLAREVLGVRDALLRQLNAVESLPLHACRIRCHGDYHLGQVLYGANDITILDFEGEPAQALAARRQKRSALYDACGMLRSFHYAATVALQEPHWQPEERDRLASWTELWYRWTGAAFLRAYLSTAREQGPAVFLPEDAEQLRALLRLHLIDKCSYELSYELNNRPAWVAVPMAGLLSLARRD